MHISVYIHILYKCIRIHENTCAHTHTYTYSVHILINRAHVHMCTYTYAHLYIVIQISPTKKQSRLWSKLPVVKLFWKIYPGLCINDGSLEVPFL